MKKIVSFGNLNLNELISRLFWCGNIPIAICSYIFMKHFLPINTVDKTMIQSNNEYSYASQYLILEANPKAAMFLLIICFVSSVVIWKVICEIIYIIVMYYKSNTKHSINE
ncbi:MAG: hypothetical protein N3I35_13100 [Clostridia bacterium]|nr:hypothetical protein [Clostridia bacterium]